MLHAVIEISVIPAGAAMNPETIYQVVGAAYGGSALATMQLASTPLAIGGPLLFAWVTWQTRSFPRVLAVVLGLFAILELLMFVPLPVPNSVMEILGHFPVLFYLSMVGYGVTLIASRAEQERALPVAAWTTSGD